MRWRTAVIVALLCVGKQAHAHPMHSTIAELTEDRAQGTVRAVIRVFADDFGTVTRRGQLAALSRDRAAMTYIASTFLLTDNSGRRVALRPCGLKESSGVVWVCVEGDSRSGLAALQLRAAVLCDLYSDQVNLVQTTIAGARRSYLFTPGAGARQLR